MSVENAKAFLKKAADDADLRAKVESMVDDGAAAVQLGAEHGFQFSADEFVTAYDEAFGELSDDELTNAAGGLGGLKPTINFD